jgi:hypothetical protein
MALSTVRQVSMTERPAAGESAGEPEGEGGDERRALLAAAALRRFGGEDAEKSGGGEGAASL